MGLTKQAQKVLIVDDEEDIRDLLSHCLKKVGYSVYTATNGREGIDAAIKLHPHLIIMDMMMPAMDGIEACGILRQTADIKDTLIVFLTARADEFSEVAGFTAGADDYISKPIKLHAFVNRVNAILRRNLGGEIAVN